MKASEEDWGLLERDKGLFGGSLLAMVHWAPTPTWASIKERKYDKEEGNTLNKNNKLPGPALPHSEGVGGIEWGGFSLRSIVDVRAGYDQMQHEGYARDEV